MKAVDYIVYRDKEGVLCTLESNLYNEGKFNSESVTRWKNVSNYSELKMYVDYAGGLLGGANLIDKTGDWDNKIVLIKSHGVAAITPEFNYDDSLDRPIINEDLLCTLINDEGYNYTEVDVALKYLVRQCKYKKHNIIIKFDKEVY